MLPNLAPKILTEACINTITDCRNTPDSISGHMPSGLAIYGITAAVCEQIIGNAAKTPQFVQLVSAVLSEDHDYLMESSKALIRAIDRNYAEVPF